MHLWKKLATHQAKIKNRSILSLFDETRAAEFSVQADELLFDYSKINLDKTGRDLLLSLAEETGVAARREAMFSGARINETEDRAVLHTALRNLEGSLWVDNEDVMPGIRETLSRMEVFAEIVRSGEFVGQGGPITDVVNIGIGGSDLGPAMATLALAPYHNGPKCHFVSNIDGAQIADTLIQLDPATTLLVIASKTFTTVETMTNAETARLWMTASVADPAAQIVALSSATEKTAEWGIAPERVFGFEDWVGGRYSLWGPIGLSLMLAIGPDQFRELLAGAATMDQHFRATPFEQNMPVMLALTGIWHRQVCGCPTRAILPYDQRLARLPAYLQQLEMESNGKRVAMDGRDLTVPSGPVVWGEPGTNGQHAFYQLIHQGTDIIPAEFIAPRHAHEPDLEHQHHLLLANCLAQSEALMRGRNLSEARQMMADRGLKGGERDRQARHRVFPGNRPSTTLLMPQLTPFTLGQLIALYEHRVFVEGAILGINSFDQWGVELGKELAQDLVPMVAGAESAEGKDGSTQMLLSYLKS